MAAGARVAWLGNLNFCRQAMWICVLGSTLHWQWWTVRKQLLVPHQMATVNVCYQQKTVIHCKMSTLGKWSALGKLRDNQWTTWRLNQKRSRLTKVACIFQIFKQLCPNYGSWKQKLGNSWHNFLLFSFESNWTPSLLPAVRRPNVKAT